MNNSSHIDDSLTQHIGSIHLLSPQQSRSPIISPPQPPKRVLIAPLRPLSPASYSVLSRRASEQRQLLTSNANRLLAEAGVKSHLQLQDKLSHTDESRFVSPSSQSVVAAGGTSGVALSTIKASLASNYPLSILIVEGQLWGTSTCVCVCVCGLYARDQASRRTVTITHRRVHARNCLSTQNLTCSSPCFASLSF